MDVSQKNSSKSSVNAGEGNSKILLLVRHAKSSWDLSSLLDFERPLNDRGKKDAPVMARRLINKKINIDAIVSSPAKRAKKTAELFSKEYGKKEKEIIFITRLYHASPEIFFDVITGLDDSLNTVAVFSHNPGITEFVNLLTDTKIDNMPTCGVFGVTVLSDNWNSFKTSKKEFLLFDYPKLV